jgi:mRNA interferase YafQ
MRSLAYTAAFRRDFKRMTRSASHDPTLLKEAATLLASGKTLPEKFRDHSLGNKWQGLRECHLKPDWLLIYQATPESLKLVRTGTHVDLFR